MIRKLVNLVVCASVCCTSKAYIGYYTRGEFNNASARRALVDWYLSLFILCKAWHQYNERPRALALLNLPMIYCRLVLFDSVWQRSVWHAQSLLAGRTISGLKIKPVLPYRQNLKKVQTYPPPKLSQHIHPGKWNAAGPQQHTKDNLYQAC